MVSQNQSLTKILFWVGDTNLFIALAAAASTLVTYAFYDSPPDYNLVTFIFFATLFTYNIQRRLGSLEVSDTHRKTKTAFIAIALIGMISFGLRLSIIELIGLSIAGVLSIGYAVPCIPFKGKLWTIREIPYMKIWVIVLAWIAGTSIVPLIAVVNLSAFDDRISTALFIIQQGAFILALTVPFDVRDLRADYPSFRTLPMVMGVGKAIRFAQNAMIIAFVAAFFNYLIGFFAFPEMLVQLFISLIGYFLVRRGKQVRKPLYYSIALDGMIILQGVAVFFVQLLDY